MCPNWNAKLYKTTHVLFQLTFYKLATPPCSYDVQDHVLDWWLINCMWFDKLGCLGVRSYFQLHLRLIPVKERELPFNTASFQELISFRNFRVAAGNWYMHNLFDQVSVLAWFGKPNLIIFFQILSCNFCSPGDPVPWRTRCQHLQRYLFVIVVLLLWFILLKIMLWIL